MKHMRKLTPLLLAVLTGCAAIPTGPGVNVLPGRGKSFEQFQNEDGICRQWAERQLGSPTQESYQNDVATGAVAGTAVGAGVGAALGSVSRHAGAGALIGAASGLLVGTAIGSSQGDAYGEQAQRRYDNAYVQCMYSYGNQVPGRHVATAAPVVAPPPPPPPAPAQPVAVAPPPPYVAPPPPYVAPTAVMAPPPPVMVASTSSVIVETPPDPVEAYPAPPVFYLDQPPQFIYSPSLNMYVAVGVPYDLLYDGRSYYYFYGGRWYGGPYYDGPWGYVPRRNYPPVFSRYRVEGIRRYRDYEYRRYVRDREHYDGRMHRPAFREKRMERRGYR